MTIVIISKNCYPALGPRAHRTTELAKELAKKGHQVMVYALLGDYDYTEISKKTGITFKNLGASKLGVTDNPGYYNKAIWAKGMRRLFAKSLEVPHIELIPMVEKALNNEGEIDYLITIAHPHTIHWGAANFAKKNKNKIKFWVADCGDPYMNNPYNTPPKYFSRYEKKWSSLCDFITVPIEDAKKAYYPEFRDKIKVIPQGFDFDNVELNNYTPNLIPTFAYSGIVYLGKRDPTLFLEYLSKLNFKFKFIVYTKNINFFKPFKKRLGDKLEVRNYIPRNELLNELSKMDFLINIKNNSGVQQPSKLIDYMLTKRPILEITSSFQEQNVFDEFVNGNYKRKIELKNMERYDIKKVAEKFVELYSEIK